MAQKVQVRRGSVADLPNPLDNGEFGWCEDTRDLYIGNGVANQNLKVAGAPVTTAFNIYCVTTALGGRTAANGATGLKLASTLGSGTTTATTANKLVNANKTFDSSVLDKLVFNTTDGTFAKVTAVDSATTLSLSADIMTTGEAYEIADAFDNLPDAFAAVPNGFATNVTIKMSAGTFSSDTTFVGKAPSGNFTVTVDGVGTTTILSGTLEVKQPITFRDLKTTKDVRARFGADITWNTVTMESPSKLYIYGGSNNLCVSSTIIVGNDPTNVTNIGSTITIGYTIYVASSTYGGSVSNDGLAITSGTASGTTANKLVNSSAAFTSAVNGMAVYNSTDKTWAKVTAVDSATQLSLSADIMASGEAYIISAPKDTLANALAAVPPSYNCNTSIQMSPETYSFTSGQIMGKAPSDNYRLSVTGNEGALAVAAFSSTSVDSVGTVTKTGAGWTVNEFRGKLLKNITNNWETIIFSNTATVITVIGDLHGTAGATDTWEIREWGTVFNTSGATGLTVNTDFTTLERIKFTRVDGNYPLAINGKSALTYRIYSYNFGYGFGLNGSGTVWDTFCHLATPNSIYEIGLVASASTFTVARLGILNYGTGCQVSRKANIFMADRTKIDCGSVASSRCANVNGSGTIESFGGSVNSQLYNATYGWYVTGFSSVVTGNTGLDHWTYNSVTNTSYTDPTTANGTVGYV